jgi:thiamine pyrophosphokinase
MTSRLARQAMGARFIAADSGIRHAGLFTVTPELWVGDFDSSDGALETLWHGVERRIYPADKAKTDGEIAADEALARGATRLVMAGALGGDRTDHTFQHLTLAMALARRGIQVVLTSGVEEAVPLLPGAHEFDLPRGTMFSLLCLSDIGGLTLHGAKWPLEKTDVLFGSSLTMSNVVDGNLKVGLASGDAILLAHLAVTE